MRRFLIPLLLLVSAYVYAEPDSLRVDRIKSYLMAQPDRCSLPEYDGETGVFLMDLSK